MTSSPISTVLALTSKVAQSPVAVWPSLEVISTFCLASTRVSCDGRLVGSVVAAAREPESGLARVEGDHLDGAHDEVALLRLDVAVEDRPACSVS